MDISLDNLRAFYLIYLRYNFDPIIGDYITDVFYRYSLLFLKSLFSDTLLELHLTKSQIDEIIGFLCQQ